MPDALIETHTVGQDCWVVDAHETGARTRWLRSDVYVDRQEAR